MQGHPWQRAAAGMGARRYPLIQALVLVVTGCMLARAGVSAETDPVAAWTPTRAGGPQFAFSSPAAIPAGPSGESERVTSVVEAEILPKRRPHLPVLRHASTGFLEPAGHAVHGSTRVALTFDDGPDDRITPAILDILKRKRVRATFYLVGMHCQRYPEVVRRITQEGHEIGNHSWSHRNMRKLDAGETLQEVQRLNEWLERRVGHRPATIRPPYGAVTKNLRVIAHQLGQPVVGWTVDTRDWAGTAPQEMARIVHGQLRPGGIVLLHSFGGRHRHLDNTLRFLPHLIDELRAQGYSFVPVSELIPDEPLP